MADRRRQFADQRKARGFSQESFAAKLGVDRTTVQRWEKGETSPQPWQRLMISEVLGIPSDRLDVLLAPGAEIAAVPDDEVDALELARQAQASDVGSETLTRLQRLVDELATQYPVVPPHDLLAQVRRCLEYVARLMDARKTLHEHRRLLVIGGWLSLLGATLHIDLKEHRAATARLQTAISLAQHADHAEIQAWCYETDAWRVLTNGEFDRALELSQAAQHFAPAGSSAAIQATAQEGRARARMNQPKETYAAIDRVQRMASSLPTPESPEHHFQYDPGKALSYTATTLAWIGDPAAESHAREVIARLAPAPDVRKWPRRVATANIDLALTLLNRGRLDEACDATQKAILSGRVAPSAQWRALEVIDAVAAHRLPAAAELRDTFHSLNARA
jgi:transcriptional regulator with XRE-family HTH domain